MADETPAEMLARWKREREEFDQRWRRRDRLFRLFMVPYMVGVGAVTWGIARVSGGGGDDLTFVLLVGGFLLIVICQRWHPIAVQRGESKSENKGTAAPDVS